MLASRLLELLEFRSGTTSARAALDARAKLFPDWGLRSESEVLSAAFDPFSLQLVPGIDESSALETRALMAGDLDAARASARVKLSFRTPAERVPYMLEITRGIHELRHFHDQFGTTAGFARVIRTLRDAHAFHGLWAELKKLGAIKLPLALWAQQPDAPSVLREYAQERRTFVEWFNLHDGVEFPASAELKEKVEQDEIMALFSMKNLNALIPYIPLNICNIKFGMTSDGRHGRVTEYGPAYQKMAPLGCSILMEGAAYVVQRQVVTWIFGKDAGEELHAWMMKRAPAEIGAFRYTAVDIYLTRKFDEFFSRNQLALTDAALMPAPKQNKPEDHPGVRFFRLAQKASYDRPRYRDETCDLTSWVSGLTRKLSWPSPKMAALRAAEQWNELPKDPRDDSFWSRIFDAFVALHLEFLELRESTPNWLTDISVYVRKLKEAPAPPVYFDNSQLFFMGAEKQIGAYRDWFMFEHFQRHILFGTTMPCAGHQHKHKCAGDPLKRWRWRPIATCPYSQFLVSLGVPELKIVSLS